MTEERSHLAAPLGHCPRCRYAVVDAERECPECGLDAAAIQSAILHQTSAIPYRPWLHRFAMLFVAATFFLIVLGGTVTSKGAGLAVPDWPATFTDAASGASGSQGVASAGANPAFGEESHCIGDRAGSRPRPGSRRSSGSRASAVATGTSTIPISSP